MRGDGKTVPLYQDHEDFEFKEGQPTGNMSSAQPRGQVTLHWNPEFQRLEFEGDVDDPELIKSIESGERNFVSLAAQPSSYDIYHGHTVPLGLDFFSLSAVKNPGVPEADMHMEMLLEGFYGAKGAKLVVVEGRLLKEDELSQDQRDAKHDSTFAYVTTDASGNKVRKLPIGDRAHAVNAKARFNQTDFHSQAAKDTARSKINGALRKFGIDPIGEEDPPANGQVIMNRPELPATGARDFGIGQISGAPSTDAGFDAPNNAIPIGEPMSAGAKKMYSAMKAQYKDPDKARSVFYATLNKMGKKDTEPLSKSECAEFMQISAENAAAPNAAPNTPPAQARTSTAGAASGVDTYQGPLPTIPRSFLRGVGTGTNIGYSSYPALGSRGTLDQKPGVPVSSQHDDGETVGTRYGFADGSNEVKKSVDEDAPLSMPQPVAESSNVEKRLAAIEKRLAEGIGDAASAQDQTVTWPSKKSGSDGSNVRHIGLPQTPFEAAVPADEEEEEEEEEEARGDGSMNIPDPNAQPTASNKTPSAAFPKADEEDAPTYPSGGTTGDADAPGDQDDDLKESKDPYRGSFVSPKMGTGTNYGYTKEAWSTLSKSERRAIKEFWQAGGRRLFERGVQLGRRGMRLELSGVKKTNAIGPRRESRDGGQNIVKSGLPYGSRNSDGSFGPKFAQTIGEFVSDIDWKIENLNDHVDVIQGRRVWASSFVPTLGLPRVGANLGPRLEFLAAITDWTGRHNYNSYTNGMKMVSEAAPAITTATSGAAIGVEEMTPALVVPTNLAALLRDTYLYKALPQGTDRARFQTVTALTMGSLTQNTAPSSTAPTLASVDVTTSPRGYLIQVSFEAERRIIGPLLDALILSGRLGELYDEDNLAVGSGQAFETASIPTTGGLYSTGNQIFGTGVSAESGVTSSMTMSLNMLTDVQETIKAQGYSPDNIVVVMAPKQFRDLMRDSNINRYISFGPGFDQARGMMGQGVIPELLGMEIRQSTLPVSRASGSGSPATTTYHAWAYKKGLTAALAASRDVMIETFRDIEAGSTWLKVHYDMGVGILHPNSLVEAVSA